MITSPVPIAPGDHGTAVAPLVPELPPLAVARLRFTVRMQQRLDLPAYAGSLLRSVFGAALRAGACITGQPTCAGCPAAPRCAYMVIFDTPAQPTTLSSQPMSVPNPYVIEPPPMGSLAVPAGGMLVFHMVLIGETTQHSLPLVMRAWQRALRSGLGQTRATGELVSVRDLDVRDPAAAYLFRTDAPPRPTAVPTRLNLAALSTTMPAARSGTRQVTLEFQTPLRLQREARILRAEELTPRTLVSHLMRRINLMLDIHLGAPPAPNDIHALLTLADTLRDDRSALHWHDMRRYSARQQQAVPLSGLLGRWALQGDLSPLLPWLALGQWLHLGKGATLGLGGYRLLAQPNAAA